MYCILTQKFYIRGCAMVTWSDNLYFGEGIKKKHRQAIFAIKHGRMAKDVFVIAFASNPNNLFDIIAADELLFPHYKNSKVHILGLAKGREEAKIIVKNMIVEVYKETGDFKVRDYFA